MKTGKRIVSIFLVALLLLTVMPLAGFVGLEIFPEAQAHSVGDTIQYGTYPQTRVDETPELQTAANAATWKSYGYYTGTGYWNGNMTPGDYMTFADFFCGGTKYRAVKFTQYRQQYTGLPAGGSNTYQDDYGYEPNTTYYFKYEPLIWRILDPSTGYIMCESIVDSQAYQNTIYYANSEYWQAIDSSVYANDYATSSIRAWLNYDFYETAFTAGQKTKVKTTALNNDGYYTLTGNSNYTQYDSASTNDKIFLLSYDEVLNSSYGFATSSSTNTARQAQGTDYAKCQGLYVNTESEYSGNSFWWLRSPGRFANACTVFDKGVVSDQNNVSHTYTGVRPACCLKSLTDDTAVSDSLFSSLNNQTSFQMYSSGSSNSLSVGESVSFYVGYYQNQKLDQTLKTFTVVNSNPDVLSIEAGEWHAKMGMQYTLSAKQIGNTVLTFTNPCNNDVSQFEFDVVPPLNYYNFNNLPQKEIETGKITHFYNHGGLIVNDFQYTAHKSGDTIDYYNVSMTIYNSRSMYGAVTTYDQDGNLRGYYLIDKFTEGPTSFSKAVKSLYYNIGDIFYLIQNPSFYSGKSTTKETKVEIKVPVGGRLEISNNPTESVVVGIANMVFLSIELYKTIEKFAKAFPTEEASERITKLIIEMMTGEIINKEAEKAAKKAIVNTFKNEEWDINNIESFLLSFSEHYIQNLGLNFIEEIEKNIVSITGIGEITEGAVFTVLPTGWIINSIFATERAINFLEFFQAFIKKSTSNPKSISISAPNLNSYFIMNGLRVFTLPTFNFMDTVLNVDSVEVTSEIDKPNRLSPHYQFQGYNIAFYQNNQEIQPDGTVEVSIPVPKAFNGNCCKVYYKNDDSSFTDMNAIYEDGYLSFTTDHFSMYIVADESEVHTYTSTVTTAPTCTKPGVMTYTCSVCGDIYTEPIPALGHTDSDNDGHCDSCGEQMTGGDHCAYCGKIHDGAFGWLVRFFHKIFALFKR